MGGSADIFAHSAPLVNFVETKWNGGPVRRPDDQIPMAARKSSAASGMASVQCATFAFAPDLELGPDGRWSRSQRTGSGTSALLRRVSLCIRPIRHHLNVCRLRHAPCATVRAVENKRLTVRTRWGVVRDAGDTRQSGQPDRWVGGVRGWPRGSGYIAVRRKHSVSAFSSLDS